MSVVVVVVRDNIITFIMILADRNRSNCAVNNLIYDDDIDDNNGDDNNDAIIPLSMI